ATSFRSRRRSFRSRGFTERSRKALLLLLGKPRSLTSHDLPTFRPRTLQQDPQNIKVVIMHGARRTVPKLVTTPHQRSVTVNANGGFVERHRLGDSRTRDGLQHLSLCLI